MDEYWRKSELTGKGLNVLRVYEASVEGEGVQRSKIYQWSK